MEAGASECPTWMNSPWVATERRTKGASPRLRVANVSEPPGALKPSWGLRFFLGVRVQQFRKTGVYLVCLVKRQPRTADRHQVSNGVRVVLEQRTAARQDH